MGATLRPYAGGTGADALNVPKSEWPSSLDDKELEELDTYLRAHGGEGDLMLDGVHGLLSAVAVGPLEI